MSVAVHVSNSAINTFSDCEGAYYITRVLELEKRDKAYPPTFGLMAHSYFERFWRFRLKGNPRRISDPMECHDVARYLMIREWRGKCYAQGNMYFLGDDTEKAQEWYDLPEFVGRTLDRYYLARGRYDAERYKPLFVEHPVTTTIYRGEGLRVINHGYVDLVTRDRETGKYELWEHKTVVNRPPRPSVRFRDSQTVIYGLQLAHDEGLTLKDVIWNYILQKDPTGLTDPDVLFTEKGVPSKDKKIMTNWEVWSERVKERGFDPYDPKWTSIRERIQNAETEHFFYREPREILVNKKFLIGNYINWAKRIARTRAEWAQGAPVLYNFKNSACEWCVGYMMCLTRLRGGKIEDAIREHYEHRQRAEVERMINERR